jgi:hypothetical protein
MSEDILHGNVDAQGEVDILSFLTDLAKYCFSCARNTTIPKEQRDEFSEKAESLTVLVTYLAKKQFSSATQEFTDAGKALQDVATEVATKLAELEKTLEIIKTANQILRIVDEGLAIAAGLAKM